MKTRFATLLLLAMFLPMFAQRGTTPGNGVTNPVNPTVTGTLSPEEEQSLYFMREEEKLAHDVYLALAAKWNLQIFSNIAKSEQRHTDRIKMLLDRYSLADPAKNEAGLFTDPKLQELYTALVEMGSASQLAALVVGATIEDLDIHDLATELEQVDNLDIEQVYDNLMRGSRNHLRAFYSQITTAGGSYTAQYISEEELEKIVTTPIETGGGSKGRGGQNRGGRQHQGNKGTKTIRVGNYPNPANPTTTIVYQLEEPGAVELTIYNSTGQIVRTLAVGGQNAGEQRYVWDARDSYGNQVTSGIYFCHIRSGSAMATHRFLLMK